MVPSAAPFHFAGADKQIRSRDAIRARVMPTPLEKPPSEQDRVTPEPAVEPAFGSIMLQRFV
jgi:hypothetical protein